MVCALVSGTRTFCGNPVAVTIVPAIADRVAVACTVPPITSLALNFTLHEVKSPGQVPSVASCHVRARPSGAAPAATVYESPRTRFALVPSGERGPDQVTEPAPIRSVFALIAGRYPVVAAGVACVPSSPRP